MNPLNLIPLCIGNETIAITLRKFDILLHAGEIACIRGKWIAIG
jgi:hypothetical protein